MKTNKTHIAITALILASAFSASLVFLAPARAAVSTGDDLPASSAFLFFTSDNCSGDGLFDRASVVIDDASDARPTVYAAPDGFEYLAIGATKDTRLISSALVEGGCVAFDDPFPLETVTTLAVAYAGD